MTATIVGPGGDVEIRNDAGPPIDVNIVGGGGGGDATEATLQAILAALNAVSLLVDGLEANTTGLGLETSLQAILAELSQKLEPGGTINVLDGHPDPLTDAELRAAPVPVSGVVTLGSAVAVEEPVTILDAAETTGLLYTTIDFNGAGAHTIVTVNMGERLRLRRFLPTACSVPDITGDPVLTITLGGVDLRSQVLIGRFDILGDEGEDLVISASKAGQIDGSVAYSLEAV